MLFKLAFCSYLFYLILLWRFHRGNCYVGLCEQPHPSMYCSCDVVARETEITCYIFANLSRDDNVWSDLSSMDNGNALSLQSRLPFQMDYIPSESLLKMTGLESLVVQEFNLGQLGSRTVYGLKKLRKLMLERNEITGLDQNAISDLPHLKKLALSENLLTEILAESLTDLNQLEQLYLDRNNISRIETCAFCDLQNLKELELWGNQISDLSEYNFRGLKALKRLDLYMNKIRILSDKVFHTMNELLEIDLKDNLIEYIAPRAFRGLNRLQILNLNHNRLKKLPSEVFKYLPSLRKIELENNQLETLQADVMSNIAHVEDPHFSISFRGNPLRCDCNLQWIHIYLKVNNSHHFTRELQDLKCLIGNNTHEYVTNLKEDCDKPKGPLAAKAKERSYEELTSLKSSASDDGDDAEEYFGDINSGSGKTPLISDLAVILAAMLVSILKCHRTT